MTELDLPFESRGRAILANGSEETLDIYGVTVLWDGRARDVASFMADGTPLVGMSLLDIYSLYTEKQLMSQVRFQSRHNVLNLVSCPFNTAAI